ncbi:uncharacterized protein LOC123659695 [Melitaea cinxia]|uniref:uncharacterized protein LOC123659695 n=1 Tax=Melitaea cinxia TaxID=113334 RepID=UPI001E26F94E|nr:uncharacterized protein LOC123659695 [Melitaea cinxia]
MFKLVVLSVILALAVAEAAVVAPLWGGLAAPWAAPWAAPLAVAAPIGVNNYRGPLSLAPGQPANILAADGRPLDTLDVNVDRAAHLTAKAIDHAGVHLLKKRSLVAAPLVAAPVAAPVVWNGVHAARVLAPVAAAPLAVGWGHGAWAHAW